MKSDEIILKRLLEDGNVNGMAEVIETVTKKKSELLKQHIDTVYPIKAPGETGGNKRYWMTKMEPKDRNHCKPLYAPSKEQLEEKILLYYLEHPTANQAYTVREAVVEALGGDDVLNAKTALKTGRRTYQRWLKYFDASLGDIQLDKLSEEDIRKALSAVISADDKITGKEFSQALTAIYKLDVWVRYNHLDTVDIKTIVDLWKGVNLTGHHVFKPRNQKTRAQAFNKSEAAKIIRYALRNPSYKALAVAVMITSGLRIGEVLGLKEEDVYLDEEFIFVVRKEDTKLYVIDDYTKSNRCREVHLSPIAKQVVEKLLEFRHEDPSDIDFLVLNENSDDGKMHCRAVDDFLRTTIHYDVLCLTDADEARSCHDCRRTYASLEYLAGTDIYKIQQQMGHSTVAQTWDYIRDVADAEERKEQIKGIMSVDDIEPANTDNLIVYADYTQKKLNDKNKKAR